MANKVKPTAPQAAVLRALLAPEARLRSDGSYSACFVVTKENGADKLTLFVNRSTVGALEARRWIERESVEYEPEREIRASAFGDRNEKTTIKPVRYFWQRITAAGREAIVGGAG